MINLPINEPHGKLDRLQLAALAGLMVLGTAFVYSATMANATAATLPWYDQSWVRQVVGMRSASARARCYVWWIYHTLSRWSFVVYWATIICLVAVMIPHIGSMRFGARRWIDFGPFQFQPSEFAKLAFILAAAHFLSRPADELRQPSIFWKGIGLLLLPFALIFKEPDLGSALVLLPTGLVMMFVAGNTQKISAEIGRRGGFAGRAVLVDMLFMPPGWWQVSMQPYQRDRLLVYFGRDYTHFCPAERHPGGVATPAPTTTG